MDPTPIQIACPSCAQSLSLKSRASTCPHIAAEAVALGIAVAGSFFPTAYSMPH